MKKTPAQLLVKRFTFLTILLLTTSLGFAQRIPSLPPSVSLPLHWPVYRFPSDRNDFGFLMNGRKHDFTIVLNNDSTIEGRCQIDTSGNIHVLKCKINGAKVTILPSETKTISHDD